MTKIIKKSQKQLRTELRTLRTRRSQDAHRISVIKAQLTAKSIHKLKADPKEF